ncbi:ATPase, T2SS/T4P/T4SS family [Paenibacillus sp. CC-CFT747]|nr:ATPase, T2SS/T4P/T4SS family [Paenibacillus sp. CC-CFT747]
MMPGKFSLLAYANSKNGRQMPAEELAGRGQAEEEAKRIFDGWAEEIRSELASGRGRSEEERQQYGEMLNRAVLGYEEDRFRILMIIQDKLAKKRIGDIRPPNRTYGTLAEAIFAEVIGLNVLELVLKNKEGLEEIQVVGTKIFEVRGGTSRPSPVKMNSLRDVERIQQNLVLYNNDTLNPRKRWAEVRLKDGSRVTMTGYGYTAEPTLTIRFYTMNSFTLQTLCLPIYETINEPIRRLLTCLLASCFNLVIIGPTNSGKTNLIKALVSELPQEERIVTIEGRFELMLKRDFPDRNIIEYEMDETDPKHSGEQAFKLALRQSPKRIVHAEIRDEDANLYVRACTRGHEGSMTSVHVNQLEDVPEAITDMCMMDGRGMNPDRLVSLNP